MNKKEIKELTRLLKELKESGLSPPNTPFAIWTELATILPAPAVEVLVTRTGRDFLLTKRNDKYWQGWHIPGGFMLAKESVENACLRIAKKELGIKVNFTSILMIYAWTNHPFANALSLVCICRPDGNPLDGHYFQEIPRNVIIPHRKFLKCFLKAKH